MLDKFFKTPRKSGKIKNTAEPSKRVTPTKAQIRLQRRIDDYEKSKISGNAAFTRPGSQKK